MHIILLIMTSWLILIILARPTDLDPFGTNVKDSHHTGDKGTNCLEVETPNTPGAIHQQHNVSLCSGLTHHIWEGKKCNVLIGRNWIWDIVPCSNVMYTKMVCGVNYNDVTGAQRGVRGKGRKERKCHDIKRNKIKWHPNNFHKNAKHISPQASSISTTSFLPFLKKFHQWRFIFQVL